jgi:8-oxo-dGTP diphosphatase
MKVTDIDWPSWKPTEKANLCFVIRDAQILLIRKKRGLGAGKINGPGGRLEPGETAERSAVRECQEEIGVTPSGLWEAGELYFHFLDGYQLLVTVFRADNFSGELKETDEADPFWRPVDKVPYEEMWQDDPHWLPLVIARQHFIGRFIFDKETLLSFKMETAD